MTKFCTQCGTSLTDGMKFCGQCGTAVATIDTPAPAVQDSPILDTKPSSPAIGGWLLVMCIYLLIPALQSIYYFLSTHDASLGFSEIVNLLGLIVFAMLVAKETQGIYIAKFYFGAGIIFYLVTFIAALTTMPFGGISVWQLIIVLVLLIKGLISFGWFSYLSKSKRIKLTFPDAFK